MAYSVKTLRQNSVMSLRTKKERKTTTSALLSITYCRFSGRCSALLLRVGIHLPDAKGIVFSVHTDHEIPHPRNGLLRYNYLAPQLFNFR